MSRPVQYIAYLMRLWRETEQSPWRATLQNPHTQKQQHFADLSGLLAYLEKETEFVWHTDSTQQESE